MLPAYDEIYSNLRIPYDALNEKKQSNKKRLRKFTYMMVLCVAFTAIYLFYLIDFINTSPLVVIGLLILSVVTVSLFFNNLRKNKNEYRTLFKTTVVGPLAISMVEAAEFPNEDSSYERYCTYEPDTFISHEWIQKSELFNTEIHDYFGEDYFEGKLGKTEFYLSELRLTREEISVDSKGNVSKTTVTLFDGALFVADFKKDFKGLTFVESNLIKGTNGFKRLIGKLVNRSNSYANYSNTSKIRLENERFNESFSVRTSDDIEARYILTSKMMERILQFYEKYSYSISISFHHSHMFIAIHSPRNFFDEGIKKINGQYNVEGIYDDIAFFIGMIEDFDLNTRIWSKV